MSAKFANPAFNDEPTGGKTSAGQSPMGSNIFIVKSDDNQNNISDPDLYRHDPITKNNIGRVIFRAVRSLWATRQTEKDLNNNKELYVKTTIRELVLYLTFIAILCVITFGMTSTKTYYFTTVLRSTITEQKAEGNGEMPSFDDIGSFEDYWTIMQGPIFNALFNEKGYNGENLTEDQYGYILFENKILGVPRFRQLRVTNHSCNVHRKFKSSIPECYAPYSSRKEDKNSFGPLSNKITPTAWEYKTASEIGGSSTTGILGRYSGGGFVFDLPKNSDEAKRQLEHLKSNLWINRGTRVVFLDFTVYNANINLFCQIKLTVEFPASGGAVSSKSFSTVKLIRYVSSMDYFVLACEILFVLFTVYYTVEEVIEIAHFKLEYFKALWNVLDVMIILISYVCVAFNVYRQIKVGQILDGLLKNQSGFADFEFITYWQTQFNNVIAFTVFLAWIKIFKYISFNKTMTQLSTTLSRCAKDVLGFSVMFMIVFLAYAQLGYLLFGTMVDDYKTLPTAIFTLFRVILGDFDFNALLNAHRILGPVFFLTYVFFVFFVLLNMFLAIINDTYSEVKSDLSTQQSEFELGDYFKKSYEKVLDRLHFKRDRIIDIQDALKTADVNKDGIIEFDEWRRELKNRGYTDVEIENVFSRYDTDGDRVLRDSEQERFRAELSAQENSLNRNIQSVSKPNDSNENTNRIANVEFSVLSRRLEHMETSVKNVVLQIDQISSKVEGFETIKANRHRALKNILKTLTDNNQLSLEAKQERLQKIIRDEIEADDLNRSTASASSEYKDTVASRYEEHKTERSRPSTGMKVNK